MAEYKEAGALRPGDVWVDLGNDDAWTLRVVEIADDPISTIIKVIGEDVASGDRHAFEFYRPAYVRLADGEEGI